MHFMGRKKITSCLIWWMTPAEIRVFLYVYVLFGSWIETWLHKSTSSLAPLPGGSQVGWAPPPSGLIIVHFFIAEDFTVVTANFASTGHSVALLSNGFREIFDEGQPALLRSERPDVHKIPSLPKRSVGRRPDELYSTNRRLSAFWIHSGSSEPPSKNPSENVF